MKFGVYAIRDVHTGFLPLTIDQNDESARRNFRHAIMNDQSLFCTHPKDYDLYKVGVFDSDSGLIDVIVPPTHLMAATDV